MGSHLLKILLLSVICPSIITAETFSYPMNDVSSVANLRSSDDPQTHHIQGATSDLHSSLNLPTTITKESLTSDIPLGLSKSEALSTKDEMVSKKSETVLVGNQNIDMVSTTYQTTKQALSDMTSKVVDGGPNNIVVASEPYVSTASSTMSTTESETVNGLSSSATTHYDKNDTTSDPKPTTEHGMTDNYNPIDDNGFGTSTYDQQTAKHTPPKATDKNKDIVKLGLISVIIIILILLLVIMIILVIRKKRRSGSQNFHPQSRKGNRQDVWAGQVPEMGEGKMLQDPVGMENGATGSHQEPGKEMTTFVNGEKKADSVVEMEEMAPVSGVRENGGEKMAKEDNAEEKRPLLEGTTEGADEEEEAPKENQFPAPPMEQELV